ncbi:hypothetical protein ACS0TY_017066 [Phlomoides rotata]
MNIIRRCSKYYTALFLLLLLLFSLSSKGISYTTDTINSSQIFRDDVTSTLTSSGGSFELGFFSPDNSKNRYVGIWYKNIPVRTVVWVANRDNPLKDESGMLKVTESGQLVLQNGTNGIVWSTNASGNVQNAVAQLLNSGNLVLKDTNDENFVWQSFSYPTDTLLPGMKLGWNFITGQEVYITSWKNSGDPASGDFTFHLDSTDHPQLVLRKGTHVASRSGPWNGVSFVWNPNYLKSHFYTYEVVINMNEVYYRDEQLDESAFTRITLSESGVQQRWIWNDRTQGWSMYVALPGDTCDTFSSCGAYASCNIENSPVCGCLNKFKPKDPQGWDRGNWSNGCVRSTPLECRKGDAFLKYPGIKLPDTQHTWSNRSMTLKECMALCSKNCSCMAYTSLNISRGENGCLLWFGELVDIRKLSPAQDIYIRVASSELDSEGRIREILIVTLSLVVGIVLLSLTLLLYLRKRKKLGHQLQKTGWLGTESLEDLELPPLFQFWTISKATNKFSIDNKLGEGGFGPVYKGQLEAGQEIAVKCLSRTSHQGVDEFKNEVMCIAKLQHRNLVKLRGWCIQGEDMMLVYEYMPNKSLDLILFDQVKSASLDWPMRFNIINSVARGLSYLHQDSCLRVIHRDLKASNILLDSDMNPKISDFGLARTFRDNETGANTNQVVGT